MTTNWWDSDQKSILPLNGALLLVEPLTNRKYNFFQPLVVEPLITTKPDMVTLHDMSFSTTINLKNEVEVKLQKEKVMNSTLKAKTKPRRPSIAPCG